MSVILSDNEESNMLFNCPIEILHYRSE